MKLVTATADFSGFFESRSIAAPLDAFPGTGFRHVDMSFYGIIYPGSPWLAPGDGWKREVDDALEKAVMYEVGAWMLEQYQIPVV